MNSDGASQERGVGFEHERDDASTVGAAEPSHPQSAPRARLQPGLDKHAEQRSARERSSVDADQEEQSALTPRDGRERDRRAPGQVVREVLDELPYDKQVELKAVLLGLSRTDARDWSGLLPHPDEFYKFQPQDRERMMRWNDAGTVDESARQDLLVAAQIREAHRGPTRAVALVTLTLLLAGVAGFGFENTVLAGIFLSPTVLMFIQSLVSSVRAQSSRD